MTAAPTAPRAGSATVHPDARRGGRRPASRPPPQAGRPARSARAPASTSPIRSPPRRRCSSQVAMTTCTMLASDCPSASPAASCSTGSTACAASAVATTSAHLHEGEEERRAGVVVGVEGALDDEQHRRGGSRPRGSTAARGRPAASATLSVKMREAGTAATASAAVATTMNRPSVRMLLTDVAAHLVVASRWACSLSWVK